ncbi:MAG: hypothetical protein AAFZ15_18020 [Bacteroidota bacterium]
MKNIICLLIGLFSLPAFSQSQLRVRSKYLPQEGMLLRIIPADFPVFYEGMKNGYIVERQGSSGTFQKLTPVPLRPAVLAMQPNPDYQLTATEILVLQMWNRRDTLEMAMEDPEGMGKGLQFGLGFFQTSSLQSPQDARRSGLVFIDKTARQGESYSYRIYTADNTNINASTQITAQTPVPAVLPKLQAEGQENMAKFEWTHVPGQGRFEGYFLEKSMDGQSFAPATRVPVFYNPFLLKNEKTGFKPNTIYYRDSLAENNRTYFYRLVGVDIFGDRTTSTQIFEVQGSDLTPPSPPTGFNVEKNDSERTVKLTWEKTVREPDLRGFNIYRSATPDSGFIKINNRPLSPATLFFSEKTPRPEEGVFYKVASADQSGNEAFSASEYVYFKDKSPPATPLGLTAAIDSNGIVSLQWQANQEPDLLGYILTAGFSEDEEFMPVSQKALRNNSFTDTLALNLQNQYYYYQIAALDKNFNLSPYSETLTVSLPDTIAPSAPLLKKVVFEKGVVRLNWVNGTENDLAGALIFRKENQEGLWQEVASLKGAAQSWVDENTVKDTCLFYQIRVFDEKGNRSAASNVRSTSTKSKTAVPAISGLQYSAEGTNNLKLSWEYSTVDFDPNYLVFKSISGKEAMLVDAVTDLQFTDTDVEKGTLYSYFVVARHPNGKLSEIGKVLEVNF